MFKCKIVQPIQLPEPYSEYTRREATVAGSKSFEVQVNVIQGSKSVKSHILQVGEPNSPSNHSNLSLHSFISFPKSGTPNLFHTILANSHWIPNTDLIVIQRLFFSRLGHNLPRRSNVRQTSQGELYICSLVQGE